MKQLFARVLRKPYEHHLLHVIVLYVLGVAIYSNALLGPFLFDDVPNIKDNASIRLQSLTPDELYAAAFESPSRNRPVANVSFALNYYVGGYRVLGYHLVNVGVHILAGVVVYFLTFLLWRGAGIPGAVDDTVRICRWLALFTAAIFIAHPVQTQAVTYVVQRMTSLATLLYLAALLLFVMGRLSACARWRSLAWGGALLAWVLALGTKEIAITLPIVVLLIEWYFFQSLSFAWLRRAFWYNLVVAVILLGLVFVYLGGDPWTRLESLYAARDFTMTERLWTEPRVWLLYLGLLIVPTPDRLMLLHPMTLSSGLLEPPMTLVAVLVLLIITIVAVLSARRYRLLSFSIAWVIVTALIESSFVGLELVYEHRLYLPMFGFALGFVYLCYHLLAGNKILMLAIAFGLTVFLATGSYLRNAVWQDHVAFWVDTVNKNPDSARARINLGQALVREGELEAAITQFREALFQDPESAEANNDLGVVMAGQGRYAEAESHFRSALQLKHRYAQAHHNYGVMLAAVGRLSAAINQQRLAIDIEPRYGKAHLGLAASLLEAGDKRRACEHVRAAVRFEPSTEKLRLAARACE